MKVDFMIIGAQKCGTSTLAEILSGHPSIVSCKKKEPHFFSSCSDWRAELDEYEELFDATEGSLLFEASTTYTFSPLRNVEIWQDIYEYNPEMKFLYLVRNPLDRIVSNYMHMYERGYTDLSIEESVKKNRVYIDVSRYATQIRPFISRFGRENVLLLHFEEFVERRDAVLQRVANFLKIDFDQFGTFSDVHANRSVGGGKRHHRYDDPSLPLRVLRKLAPPLWERLIRPPDRKFATRPSLPPPYKRMILNQLELDISELERLLGKNLNSWREV